MQPSTTTSPAQASRRDKANNMKKKLLALAICLGGASPYANAEVTYQDILLDPDNIELNRQFIELKIASGDLPPALSAVERIIQLQPLNIGARILRARLLISLGNFATAKTELEALDFYSLPSTQASEVNELLIRVESSMSRWKTTGFVSLTANYDNNVGSITETGKLADTAGVLSGTSFDSEGFSTKRSDTASGITASVSTFYDIGSQTNDNVYIQVTGQKTSGDDSKLKDLHSGGLTIGTNLNTVSYRTNTFVKFDKLHRNTVKDRSDLPVKRDDIKTITAGTQISRQLDNTNLQFGYDFSIADFSGRSLSDDSDSKTHSLSMGLFSLLNPSTALFSGIGYQQRRADNRSSATAMSAQDRDVIRLNAGITSIFAEAHRVTSSVSIRDLRYKKLLSGVDQFIRDDRETTLSLAYRFNAGSISENLLGWSFNATVTRVENNSNMASYDITNNLVTLGVTYEF